MKLEAFGGISSLRFDIPDRKLEVFHTGEVVPIEAALDSLGLSSKLLGSEPFVLQEPEQGRVTERRLLLMVLGINFFFFVLEVVTGLISHSVGLLADSLDMLADAVVYALSLYAVGHVAARKKQVAALSGYFQAGLALFGLFEVLRRFLGYEEVPHFQTMIVISSLALTGNAACLYLLQRSGSKEAHMQASLIFTSNDVLANLGVIVAGIAVYFTKSSIPDLIVGTIVFVLVAKGALRILKLAKN